MQNETITELSFTDSNMTPPPPYSSFNDERTLRTFNNLNLNTLPEPNQPIAKVNIEKILGLKGNVTKRIS